MVVEKDYETMECMYKPEYKCGTFRNLDDLYKNGGQDFCKKRCAGTGREGERISRQRKKDSEAAFQHKKRYPPGQVHRALKKRKRRPHEVPVRGRRIAPFKIEGKKW